MHRLFLFAASAALSTVAFAQSPLTTLFAQNNSGSVGGAVYFDVTTTPAVLITGIDVNLIDVASTPGTIEVWTVPLTRTGNQTNQAAWTMVGTGTVTAAGAGLPTTINLGGSIPLPAATTLGMAFRAIGVAHAYTNGTGGNQNYATAELALAAGEASNVSFTAPLFTPRVVNCTIRYSTSGGTVAVRSPYGTGGGGGAASAYEFFATPAGFDLNGVNLEFNERPAGGWTVTAGTAAVSAAAATPLALTDDSEVTQALSSGFAASVNICSNGFISVGGSNGTSFTPDVNTFLNMAFETWQVWHDYNPGAAGSGQVKYEFTGGKDVITWDGVYDFAGPNPNTFQFRLSGTSPNRKLECSTVALSGLGNAILVGYSPAGPSANPGNTDISATALPVILSATDVLPVTLGGTRPVLGTSANLDTTNIPAGSLGGVTLLSAGQNLAGLDLTFFGMPGNRFYLTSLDASLSAGFPSIPVPVPNNNVLLGAMVFWQSAVVNLAANARGVLTSNGLKWTLGNL